MIWMIAEDEVDLRNLITILAKAWGHEPIAFPTGRHAMEFLDQMEAGSYTGSLPQFALMDIRMPGFTGDQIAKRMRSLEAFRHIPIVLMTAYELEDTDRARMLDDGVDRIIRKPLPDSMDLQALLNRVIADKTPTTNDQA